MDAPQQLQAPTPEPLDEASLQLRLALEDAHEELLLLIWELEEEWRLDDRIAYSLRQPR